MSTKQEAQMLSDIIALAATSHRTMFDKGGHPYILHPLAVMFKLGPTADIELKCIAVGHDLVEDCMVTYHQLREIGLSERIVQGIKAMTKVPGETLEEYKARILANVDAMQVKLCDLAHNSDITRLKDGGSEKDAERVTKYQRFYTEILAELHKRGISPLLKN